MRARQNSLFLVEYPFNGSWTPARILQFVPKRYSDIFYLWSSRALYLMKMHSEQGLNGGSKLFNACVTVPVCEPEPHKIPLMLTWLWERAQREEVAVVPFQSTVPFHLILPSDTNKRIRAHSFRQSLHSRQCGEELSKIALDSGADLSFKSASTMAVGRLISLGYEKRKRGRDRVWKSKMRFDYHPHNSHLRHAPSLNLLVYDKTVETLLQDNLIVQDYFRGCRDFERDQ